MILIGIVLKNYRNDDSDVRIMHDLAKKEKVEFGVDSEKDSLKLANNLQRWKKCKSEKALE